MKGFTLIEVLICVAIIGVLMAVAIPNIVVMEKDVAIHRDIKSRTETAVVSNECNRDGSYIECTVLIYAPETN